MARTIARPAIVPAILSCIGPFAIDLYLPALPGIGRDLGTSMQTLQGTLTACFVAMGLAQMICGPWADQAGYKLPLHGGIGIFLLGTGRPRRWAARCTSWRAG